MIRIYNRDYSDACAPKGDGQCDGYEDFDVCECPCHEAWEEFLLGVHTVAQMKEAHVKYWKAVPLG